MPCRLFLRRRSRCSLNAHEQRDRRRRNNRHGIFTVLPAQTLSQQSTTVQNAVSIDGQRLNGAEYSHSQTRFIRVLFEFGEHGLAYFSWSGCFRELCRRGWRRRWRKRSTRSSRSGRVLSTRLRLFSRRRSRRPRPRRVPAAVSYTHLTLPTT